MCVLFRALHSVYIGSLPFFSALGASKTGAFLIWGSTCVFMHRVAYSIPPLILHTTSHEGCVAWTLQFISSPV